MSYVPDIVTPFCLHAIKSQAEITKQMVTKLWRNKIFEEGLDDFVADFKLPFESLATNIKVLCDMEEEVESMIKFFNKYPSLDLTKVKDFPVMLLDTKEITSISSRFISTGFPNRLQREIEDILHGKKKITDVITKYSDPVNRAEVTSEMFSSTIPEYVTLKHLANLQIANEIYITKTTIQKDIIPFLMEFTDVKLHGATTKLASGFKASTFKDIAKAVEMLFRKLFDEIDVYKESMKKAVKLQPDLTIKEAEIETLFGCIFTLVYNSETRLLVLLFRMVRAYTANIHTLLEVKSKLSWKDGLSSEAFTEEYDDEDRGNAFNLSMTNSAKLIEVVDELITCIINCCPTVKYENINAYLMKYTATNPYLKEELGRMRMVDDAIYVKSYGEFHQICTSVEALFSSVTTSSLDDNATDPVFFENALKSCGLSVVPNAIFSRVQGAGYDVVPRYPNPTPALILTELSICKRLIMKFSADIKNLNAFLSEMEVSLRTNPNNMYLVDTHAAHAWVQEMIVALAKFNEDMAMDIRARISKLADLIPAPMQYQKRTVVYDLSHAVEPKDEPETICAYEEDAAEKELAELNQYYATLYQKKKRGEIFLEDDTQGQQNSGNQSDQGNANGNASNTGTNSTDQKDQNSTKPVVKDNGASNNNNGTNQNQNGEDKSSGGTLAKLKNAINKIIEAVKGIFADSKSKNLAFLSKNKEFLLNRNYTNTSVDMLPYIANTNYMDIANKCVQKAGNIDQGTLKSTDEKGIRNSLFSDITMPETDNLKDDLVHGLKVGKGELKITPVADNALKALIPNMIKYCETYYNNMESDLTGLQKTIDDLKLPEPGEDKKMEENINILITDLTDMVNAVRIASKDRCNDYLSVLSSLASSNNKDKNDKNTK